MDLKKPDFQGLLEEVNKKESPKACPKQAEALA